MEIQRSSYSPKLSKPSSTIRIAFFCFILGNLFLVNAQVKEMIDQDQIKRLVTEKYKSVYSQNVELDDRIEIQPAGGLGSGNSTACVARGISYASKVIEIDRLEAGIKKSAKTTVDVFASTLKTFGFGYAVDGVKILALLDDVQKEGGDVEDFAKGIAKYAFDKGSGALLDKAKAKAPDLFKDDTLSGEGLKFLANLAKSESNKFFNTLLNPAKKELYQFEKNGNCKEYHYAEIVSNEDKIIKDHVGPVLIMKVGFFCECQNFKVNELKQGIVKYNIPLDLVKNPNASNGGFFSSPPDYVYAPIEKKITITATADCCDMTNSESISFSDQRELPKLLIGYGSNEQQNVTPLHSDHGDKHLEPNTTEGEYTPGNEDIPEGQLISGKFGFGAQLGAIVGEEADFFGFNWLVSISYLINLANELALGLDLGYSRFTGSETDFGFETEGVSFIPVKARLDYPLNDILSLSGSVGYAFSATDGVDGGFTFSIGPELSICPSWDVSLGYNSILLGEERSFNSITGGIHFRF